MTILLDRKTIEGLISMEESLEMVGKAFGELTSGTAIMPQRLAMTLPQVKGWAAFMPAFMSGMGALGVKAVTVYGDNPTKYNMPSTLGTTILLDPNTGKPLCIMDAGFLTAIRTGAVSGVATKYMARQDAKVVGVLGSGVQARTQVWGVVAAKPSIKEVVFYSLDTPERKKAFADDLAKQLKVTVKEVAGARQVAESDVVCLATTSPTPVVEADWFKPGTHINGVGSHSAAARELDTKTIQKAKIVCDQTSACLAEAGDLIIPIKEGHYSADKIFGELGELVTGKKKGRANNSEITLFKSVGLSIQDISTSQAVYQKALKMGVGVKFEF